jgi:hypothetical protein
MHGIEKLKIAVFIIYSTYELVILTEACFVLCKIWHETLSIHKTGLFEILNAKYFDTNPRLILVAVLSVFWIIFKITHVYTRYRTRPVETPSENVRDFIVTAVSAGRTPRPSTFTFWGIRLKRVEGWYHVTYSCHILSMNVDPWISAIRSPVSL